MAGKSIYEHIARAESESQFYDLKSNAEQGLEKEDRRLAIKLLRRRDNILKAVYLFTERFLRMPPSDSSIAPILEKLGHAAEVSRVYIFENHIKDDGSLFIGQHFKWNASGKGTQRTNPKPQAFPWIEAGFERWVERLRQHKLVYGHTSDFPEQERSFLAAQSIISIMIAPIFVGGNWWGIIGFDECRTKRKWSPVEIEALKTAANIIGAAIQRKQAEEALLDSEQKYRLVVENANEGIVITQDEMLKLVNPQVTQLTGFPENELKTRTFLDYIHPDDKDMVIEHHRKRLTGEEIPEIYSFRLIDREGNIRWIQNNGVIVEWDGRPATLNFLLDITEHKEAEDALRKSEAQKKAILDATIDWIRHVDKDLRILWSNQTTLEGLQLPPEKILGRCCYKLFFNRETPCDNCPTLKAMKSGKIEREIVRFDELLGKKGEFYWDYYSVPIRNKTGEINSFIQISRNITEQIQAEKALRESEGKYRQLFENESDAVMIFDADTLMFEDANQATLNLFGYSKKEFQSLRVEDISAEKNKTRISVDKVIKDQPDSNKVPLRYFKRKDGSIFPGEITAGKFVAEGRKKIIGAVRDISDRVQAEDKIHTLNQELIKAQENERNRIARYLHDKVAQDLSTLKIGLETLFDNPQHISGELNGKMAELSKILQESISTVRDLSYDLRPPGMDQLGLVRTIFQYCDDFSEKNNLTVDFYTAGMKDLKLDFDTEINLFRLIQEGLNNIKQHAQATHVTIRLVASSPNIILRIEDNGRGFDVESRLARSLKEKRMGLSSMEERVNLLGGTIKISSRPSKGTKIFIEVPCKERQNG